MDGDGDLDLVSANQLSDSLTVFLQTSPGRFDASPLLVTDPDTLQGPMAVTAADLDGDGDPDIVSANFTSKNLTIFWGDHEP